MSINGAGEQITSELLKWQGIEAAPHRFGGTEYRIDRREIGHIHGDHMLDIPFPTKVRNQLVQNGRAEAHHLLSESGWISFYIREEEDVDKAINLLRTSYDIATKQQRRRKA